MSQPILPAPTTFASGGFALLLSLVIGLLASVPSVNHWRRGRATRRRLKAMIEHDKRIDHLRGQ